ncbi:hypothetical protein N8134_02750 [Flavobacteriales bacterium]|nr:hypothetical protein [Flavobacteriales bacterium]
MPIPQMVTEWTLFTEWFWPKNKTRRAEIKATLEQNISSIHIDVIVLFCETKEGLEDIALTKVRIIESQNRPTYNDLFKIAARDYSGKQVVIANNDISFAQFNNFVPDQQTVYPCSRYEWLHKELIWFDDFHSRINAHERSQDAWFFIAGLKIHGGFFPMGTPGCDSRLNWLLHESGIELINVGRMVRLIHNHVETNRNYSKPMLPSPRMFCNISGVNTFSFHWKKRFLDPTVSWMRNIPIHKYDIVRSLFSSKAEFYFTTRFYFRRFMKKLNLPSGT